MSDNNNNKERSSDESSNNARIKHFADASFLFAFNDDNDDENEGETNYEEIRALSKRMKALGCTKVTESFALKTNDATHVVCRSEEEYNSLWEESQNDADSFFELVHDDEKRAPPVKCTFEFARRSVEEKKVLDVHSNILFRPPKTSEKILKGLKICQTSYTGPRRNDVKSLIERLGAEYSKPFDKTCTHLCCYQFEGKKYEKAVSDGTTIVSHAWLEACYVSGEKVDASRYMRSGEEEDRLAQEKDVVPDSEAEEEQEEEEEEIEDAIEDVVAVVNVKKKAQKMKEYNLNNNASGKKGDESNNESAKSVRFEALKKLNGNNTETQEEPSVYEIRVNKVSETPTEPSVGRTTAQKEKEDEETEIPATEAQARPSALAHEGEEEKEEAPSSANSKKYPSPDYNNLPPEQVERCVRNIIDPTHSKSSNEFQGLLADADDVEAALNNGGTFAMANSFPRFGDGDGPLCKETDDDAFFELLMAGKIPTLVDEYNNRAKIDRVSKGKRVFEVLRDVEEIEHDFGLPELGVELIDVSKGQHKVHQSRRELNSDTFKAVCFNVETTNVDDDKFDEIRANALTCLNEAERYAERGPLGRAVTSRLALERAQNGTLRDSNTSDDPDALLATFVNVYLRYGYNYTPRAVREMFMTNNGTKIIQDYNFVVTLPERKPGNLPNVVLESVDRTIGQVVAGFFELLAGPTQPDPTQRVPTQPSARKENNSQQLQQSPHERLDLTQLATQLATQPPAATQTWEPTSEDAENVDEEVQEGEEDVEEEAMPARGEEEEDNDDDDDNNKEEERDEELEEIEPDQHERAEKRKHYISGSMEKSTSKSNNSGYKTALDTQATTSVDVAEAEEEEEAPPVLEPVPAKRMTRQRRGQSTRISAPTAEQQRKSLEMSAKEVVDKSSAKRKEKTTTKTVASTKSTSLSPPSAPKRKRKADQTEKAVMHISIKRSNSARATKGTTKRQSNVVRVALSGFNTEELKKRVSVLKKLNIPYSSSGRDWDESITHVVFGVRGTRSLKFLAALASGAHVLNETYPDECEAQNSSKDSMPIIDDKHFFKGGKGLENKLICASASKFWHGWHASASKSTTNRGADASSTMNSLKPFSNLDVAVASFGSNANAKGEHQMVCDVLRVGGANVKTISANGDASLTVHATRSHEDKMAIRDSGDEEEDAVDIIVCNEDKAESGRVKKAMDAYPAALVVSSEFIKRFLSSPGDDLNAYTLFETTANEKVEDSLIKRRLGGPHAVSLGAEMHKKRKFHQFPAGNKVSSNKKAKAKALPILSMSKNKKPGAAAAKKKNAPTRALAAKRFPVEQLQQQTRGGRRATRALGTIN